MTEREAIERLRRGDIAGLKTLVEQHELRAIRAATLITHDAGLAQEVVQAAFLRDYERIEQFDARRPFAPWFLRIVVNDAIKVGQWDRRHASLDAPATNGAAALYELLPDAGPAPDEQVNAAMLRERVWDALGTLSPRQRAAVVLRYYIEMSEAEMARELDVAPGTVKWHLHQARQRLRDLLGATRPEVK